GRPDGDRSLRAVAVGGLAPFGLVRRRDRRVPGRDERRQRARGEPGRGGTMPAPARGRLCLRGSRRSTPAAPRRGGTGARRMTVALIRPPTAVSFRTIGGLPLIRRTVLGAFRAGFERVLVMAGADATRLRHMLAADARTRGVEVVDGRLADTLG